LNHLAKILIIASVFLIQTSSAFAGSVGGSMGNVVSSFTNFPTLLSTFAYLAGIFSIAWAIFTFRDHVDGGGGAPPLSTAVKRMLMGGMFLATPAIMDATVETLIGNGMVGSTANVMNNTSCNATGPSTLDTMAVCFISDISGPISLLLSAFCYIGGAMLILFGISRVTRSYQEGARGPTGIGTIMTFLSGGALLSLSEMMGAFSTSLFGGATASITPQLTGDVAQAVGQNAQIITTTISAVVAFIGIVGWIAFIRGWFVLKAVADGSQQASITQALTFLFGGALAVNIGDVVNAISASVGGQLGIAFT